MHCTMLFFAQARDIVGCDRLMIDIPERASVRDALDAILRDHPALESLRDRLAVAVNERYAPLHAVLTEGCTIALIPPVSGG